MNRKEFIRNSVLAGGAALTLTGFNSVERSELFDPEEIDEFVGAAHSSLPEVSRILKAKPLILNCTSQMAKGDFETAMGGASHMGHKDIAEHLLLNGARLDIFNFTFLGFTGFVSDWLSNYPELLNSYGPHGFTLLHHAKVGGHSEFADWLQKKGLNKEIFDDIFEW